MELASIMVHVGADAGVRGRVEIARSLATRFEARLIGIAGQAAPPLASGDVVGDPGGVQTTGGDIVEGDEPVPPSTAGIVAWLAGLEDAFRAKVQIHAGVTFRRAVEQPTTLIVREARSADLVILGRAAASDIAERAVDPASVLVRCGRPVLVVPDGVDVLAAERVLVGWKETREARRAVRDAIGLLKRAKEVTIATIAAPNERPADTGPLDDVAAYLAWHSVRIGAVVTPRWSGNIGQALSDIAAEKGADLIVAGGYGHSRLHEWVFGGVTRELLRSSPLCCLLSH